MGLVDRLSVEPLEVPDHRAHPLRGPGTGDRLGLRHSRRLEVDGRRGKVPWRQPHGNTGEIRRGQHVAEGQAEADDCGEECRVDDPAPPPVWFHEDRARVIKECAAHRLSDRGHL